MNDQDKIKLFNIGVKAIIISNDKVLTLLSYDETGKEYIDLPGGRINEQESIQQTLTRELQEELLGIQDIQIGNLIHAGRRNRDLKNDIGLMFIYYSVDANCSQIMVSPEHHNMQWKSWDDLVINNDNVVLQPEHKIAIQKAINK